MKNWEVVAKTGEAGDLFCCDCHSSSDTPVFAGDAGDIDGRVCDGCGAVFLDMEWTIACTPSAVSELAEACDGEEK